MTQQDVVTLHASPPRRFLAVSMLALLGGLLIYLALSIPFGASQIAVMLGGAFALAAAVRLQSATAQVLELTAQGLRVQGGVELAALDAIVKVERGAFAFKPSNGFAITLRESHSRLWAPGLYWRFGRRLGIGGVTGAPQSKVMAEALAVMLAARSAK